MRTGLKAVNGGDLRENNIKVDLREIRMRMWPLFVRKKFGHNGESL